MSIDMYTVFNIRQIRKALSLSRTLISALKDKHLYTEDAVENLLKQAEDENTKDVLEYTYRFLTNLAFMCTGDVEMFLPGKDK